MIKIYSILFILLLYFSIIDNVFAQLPEIHTINKKNAPANEVMFITGKGFSANKDELKVFFGPVSGTIVNSTASYIEVRVPAGTAYGSISVTHLISGLTAYSGEHFDLNFQGAAFNAASMAGQLNFNSESGVFDLCHCDMDGDGKTDIATSSTATGVSSLYRNTSTPGTIGFVRTTINFGVPLYSVSCRDLDGDGRPELLAARTGSNSTQLFIAKNNSTPGNINFAAPVSYHISGNNLAKVIVRDLDNDGKPEIIVTNRFNNKISIFQNNSTPGSLNINSEPIELTISETSNTQGLSVEDLNGDGLPEIIVSTSNGSNLFYARNTSHPGNISFSAPVTLRLDGPLVNIVSGDLNQDGFPEIVVTNITNNNVAVFKNTTTRRGGTISFDAPLPVSTINNPWGVSLGDLDGDGKTDIVVASNDAAKITFLKNTSNTSSITFSRTDLDIDERSRNILMGDIDGDGKPDLAFTSTLTHKLSVLRNGNCLANATVPAGNVTMCQGSALRILAQASEGADYLWKRNGVDYKQGAESFLEVTEGGDYTVTITEAGGACETTSAEIKVNAVLESAPAAPAASNDGPVCEGETLKLTAGTISGVTYHWTGPNNFVSEIQNPEIANFDASMAGVYFLEVKQGSCLSEKVYTVVEVNRINPQVIQAHGPTTLCEGSDVILSVPSLTEHEYQWKLDGEELDDATSSTLQADKTGNYTVVLKKNGCTSETPLIRVDVFPPPVASFSSPRSVCANTQFSVIDTSEIPDGAVPEYLWDFGDGTTASTQNATHQYSEKGNYLITLTVSYGGEECLSGFASNILVDDQFDFDLVTNIEGNPCQGDEVILSAPGNFMKYQWSTGSTEPTLTVTESGIYSLQVETSDGCVGTGEIEINFLLKPVIDVTAGSRTIGTGETVQLFVLGADSYSWSPAESLDDPNSESPIASPQTTTTYTVTGLAINGCTIESEITIQVLNSINVNPKKIFTPNGDQIEDLWVIDRIENYQSCQLEIFDRQGVRIFRAKPYNNNWDGTFNGKPVREGVYFYTLKCNEGNKSGTITLIR